MSCICCGDYAFEDWPPINKTQKGLLEKLQRATKWYEYNSYPRVFPVMPFVGIVFRSTWKPFEPLQPKTSWESSKLFIPIIAKRIVYHGTWPSHPSQHRHDTRNPLPWVLSSCHGHLLQLHRTILKLFQPPATPPTDQWHLGGYVFSPWKNGCREELDESPKLRLYFDTWIYINGDNNWEISPLPILQVNNPPSDHFMVILKWCRPMGNPINTSQRCRSDRSANGQDGEPCSRDQPPDLFCQRLRSDDQMMGGGKINSPWKMKKPYHFCKNGVL